VRRELVGDDFPLAFDAQQSLFSIGAAIRVGRVLEDLGYLWFEEPVEYYHPKANGRGRAAAGHYGGRRASSRTPLQSVAALIESGVRMVQPDIVKMGGVDRPDAVRRPLPRPWRRVRSPPDGSPRSANGRQFCMCFATHMRSTKPAELADGWSRGRRTRFRQRTENPDAGCLVVPDGAGLGPSRSMKRWLGASPASTSMIERHQQSKGAPRVETLIREASILRTSRRSAMLDPFTPRRVRRIWNERSIGASIASV